MIDIIRKLKELTHNIKPKTGIGLIKSLSTGKNKSYGKKKESRQKKSCT